MAKHRNLESGSEGLSKNDCESSNKASLEANLSKVEKLPADLPQPPTDGKFQTLLPYIYDYCRKIAHSRLDADANKPIKVQVPLPFGKKFHYDSHKVVNKGYSQVDSIDMGKSGLLESVYQVTDGKEVITFDKSTIQIHSLVAPLLKSKETFRTEQLSNAERPVIIFKNAAKKLPQFMQDHIHADPREIIVADPYAPADIPFNQADKAEKKK
ncbi:MAG: hypothetical protein K2Y22_08330 [Candidatus Obscuribacterales bacterium]|nr:hypothetical protein [Candidatus Obscuribacterales bacterium]